MQRMPVDAQIISDMSIKFFDIIYDICREAKITSKVAIVPAAVYQAKQHAISTEKILPGIASLPISKQLDDSLKRTKSLRQQEQILLKSLRLYQNLNPLNHNWNIS